MSSKITQNYENLVTRNQENPRKKTSRNGTVAGYARSALDTFMKHHFDEIDDFLKKLCDSLDHDFAKRLFFRKL